VFGYSLLSKTNSAKKVAHGLINKATIKCINIYSYSFQISHEPVYSISRFICRDRAIMMGIKQITVGLHKVARELVKHG